MTKKEHYIPRAAYLRRFSNTHYSDDKKNKLIAYATKEKRLFSTNVYDSAAVNNIYENFMIEDNSVEDLFAMLETDLAQLLDMLEKLCTNPVNLDRLILKDNNEKDSMKFFVVWQFFRTERRKIQTQKELGDPVKVCVIDII